MRLEYLTCPKCGAPTPLLSTHQVECVYCAALIDVPPHIRAPLLEFQFQLLELKQRAFQPHADPERRLSNVLILSMALLVDIYLLCWWSSFVPSWSALDRSAQLVMVQLIALPPCLLFAVRLLSGDERDYFRKANLAFASLTLDTSAMAKAALSCPRCAAPLDYKETKDVVVSCRHCESELLIPSLLLSDQLQDVLKRVLAMRGQRYDRSSRCRCSSCSR